ncbi:MAG: hypothetical protein NXI30_06830 [bacterium]|nr:hypothetical protein [bacterium]
MSHDRHDAKARNGQDLYFLGWDRRMGTLDEGYEEAFAEMTDRRPVQGAARSA